MGVKNEKNGANKGNEDFTRFKTFLYHRAFTDQLKLYPEKTILMNIVVWIKETWTSLAMFNHYTAQCKFKKISDSRVEALPLIILNYYKFVYGLITTLSPSIPRKLFHLCSLLLIECFKWTVTIFKSDRSIFGRSSLLSDGN